LGAGFEIHREGYPFIALFAAVNLLAFLLAPGWVGCSCPSPSGASLSSAIPSARLRRAGPDHLPADGKLLPIVDAVPPAELGMGEHARPRLSIFMNVFNVHVNRNPVRGHVIPRPIARQILQCQLRQGQHP
jgi:phosphatidylserine decarboxylase